MTTVTDVCATTAGPPPSRTDAVSVKEYERAGASANGASTSGSAYEAAGVGAPPPDVGLGADRAMVWLRGAEASPADLKLVTSAVSHDNVTTASSGRPQ